MRVQDYEYNEEAEGKVSQKRGEKLIEEIEMKIRKNSVPHSEILKIAQNDDEDEFLYNYLTKKGVEIRTVNITMEDVPGTKRVAKNGTNYYDLPEVIDPELEMQLFERLSEIKKEKTQQGIEYKKDNEYKDVRRQIAEGNLRLVKYITTLKQFRNVNIEPDDLLAFGYRGLNNAIDRFDHTMGYKFSTYAWIAIYRKIEMGIANEYGMNQNQYAEYKKIQKIRGIFVEKKDREPTADELSDILGYPVKKVERILKYDEIRINPDSVEEQVYGNEEDLERKIDQLDDSETVMDYGGVLYDRDGNAVILEGSDDAIDFENDVQKNAQLNFLKKKINEILETITPREAEVLRLRFGLRDGKLRTLEDTGKEINVTRERVRQIEAKALRKLRHPSRSKQINDF